MMTTGLVMLLLLVLLVVMAYPNWIARYKARSKY